VVVARPFIRSKAVGGGSRPLPYAAGRTTGRGPAAPRPSSEKKWGQVLNHGVSVITLLSVEASAILGHHI